MAKRGFVLFYDYAEQFGALSDASAGKLIKAIFEYETTSATPKLPPKAEMAFMFIKNSLDENKDKYEKTCEKRSEAGIKSGEIRHEQMLNKINTCSFSRTKRTDTDTETETETDTVTETDTKRAKKTKGIPQKLIDAGFDFDFDDIYEKP